MYSNQQPPVYSTQQYTHNSQSNSRNNSLLFDQSATNNYVPPNSSRSSSTTSPTRSNSSGAIEKTNKMSSENPFHDPARSYEQLNSARTVTSITSPSKQTSGVNKTLNLSDDNPFHAVYGSYRYPSQVDPSKRITNQSTAIRSADSKSLNLSDQNPFHSNYARYQNPSQIDSQKRITELPKSSAPLITTNEFSNGSVFGNYRPSLIREYSANGIGTGLNPISTSIADWTRNNPAPLSYRPIQVQRPPAGFYNQTESSYVPPPSPPRQQRQLSPPPLPSPPPARIPSQSQKPISAGPLEKTSLNMSPDNPFADAYNRYHYPSPAEIKVQKRTSERNTRFTEQIPVNENRITQPTKQMTEDSETEKKDAVSGKGNTKFTRFDVTF